MYHLIPVPPWLAFRGMKPDFTPLCTLLPCPRTPLLTVSRIETPFQGTLSPSIPPAACFTSKPFTPLPFKSSGPKLIGSNCPSVFTTYLPSLSNMKTGISSPQNSLRNCLHIPHGLAGGEISVATARALKSRWPSVTALPSATRSAQVPTG